MEVLKDVGMAITTMPEDFKPHKQVKRVYDQRKAMVESGEGVDWGMAEALAFGTLLIEGAHALRPPVADSARRSYQVDNHEFKRSKAGYSFSSACSPEP